MARSRHKNRKYSTELKIAAVQSYQAGEGSLRAVCKQYNISDKHVLQGWIAYHNGHKEFKRPSAARGALYMAKGKKTTQQERAEIVAFCLQSVCRKNSDRGFQYTSKLFRAKLEKAGMTQSMSRVGRCIDNGPMEGFWGILKSEMYYLRKFTNAQELIAVIESYIHFYNTGRYQKRLKYMTPMEFHVAAA